ncbi:MAG TPA: Hsp20/alpha crystallin family protein [Archaeoglobaceae archaeon]|nr:Hsp20/alpha crystallin family protein [Archaeoglobaceae archaeon]
MVWIDPFDEIRKIQHEINRMFSSIFARPSVASEMTSSDGIWREPLIDIFEDESHVIVTAEIPGVDKEDIGLNVTEEGLEIRAEKRKEKREETEKSRRLERSYTGFYRYIELPVEVVPEKATATYRNGILEVKIPKTERKRNVEIKVQ